MKKFSRYISLLKPFKWQIFGYLLLLLCCCACNLTQPYLIDVAVEQINEIGVSAVPKDLLSTCLFMIGLAALSLCFVLGAAKLSAAISTGLTALLRTDIFEHASNMSDADIRRIGVAAMLDRSTYDILGLMDFLSLALNAIVTVPVYIIVGCAMAFSIDGALASIMIVFIPLIVVMIVLVTRLVQPLQKRSNKFLDKQNALVHERLSGIRVIRAFNREPYEHARIAEATNIMADNFVKTNVTMSLMSPIATLIMNIVTVLVLFIGGKRITAGAAVSTGDIVQLLQYLSMIMSAIFTSAWAIAQFPRVRVSVSRMNEIFDSKRIERGSGDCVLDGTIVALGAAYRYPDSTADSLQPVTFSVKSGEKIALIGGTGSGKSTLMMMFTGMTKPTSGELIIGGKPSSILTVDEIGRNVSTVFQKSDFFTATLRENIDPLGKATDEQVFAALDCAEFGDFARQVGLDYMINQNGSNLSGGQKQRLALARAFLRNTPIYLFDDSFSALDYLTEKRVRQNMNAALSGKTCIIATQRVSTAYNCDKILLFDGGKLIAVGTHSELMNNDIYKEIYISQTGGARGDK
ncbi:MAG: ABC transporter ATP-binding protein/permease [Roseburia sp.]|nr:ABC transporter ATP-binding protein/permease [Roseburia sp.]